MSHQAKRELLVQVAMRYREAGRCEKVAMLDEFVVVTGYARKYAIRLLRKPPPPVNQPVKGERKRRYGEAVQAALEVAWQAANGICAKRLVPFLPALVDALERHGHLQLSDEVRTQLLAISPATADRILAKVRKRGGPRGLTTTTAGKLLKHQVPVRTFADWNETQPGFFEGDLVALWSKYGWVVSVELCADGYCYRLDRVYCATPTESGRRDRCPRAGAPMATLCTSRL